MPRLGAHMSISGGLHKALERGQSIGCEAIQIFMRNNTRWKAKARTPKELELYRQTREQYDIHPIVAHAIYLINLATPEEVMERKSLAAFAEELARCHEANIPYLVIHPGSHKGSGVEAGCTRIAERISSIYEAHPEYTVITLLENTAGMGNTIGRTFEELAQIAAQMSDPSHIGYCFDTAHGLAGGYEFRTPEGYAQTFEQFDRLLGLDKLRCFHLNDSKYDLGAKRDRHQHIGQGFVGQEAFRLLLNDPRFADLPMLLETPKGADKKKDIENLALLRSFLG